MYICRERICKDSKYISNPVEVTINNPSVIYFHYNFAESSSDPNLDARILLYGYRDPSPGIPARFVLSDTEWHVNG